MLTLNQQLINAVRTCQYFMDYSFYIHYNYYGCESTAMISYKELL